MEYIKVSKVSSDIIRLPVVICWFTRLASCKVESPEHECIQEKHQPEGLMCASKRGNVHT